MANVLKSGKTYKTKRRVVGEDGFYLRVEQPSTDRRNKRHKFFVKIYSSLQAAQTGLEPEQTIPYIVAEADGFDTYFTPKVLDKQDNNPWRNSYMWLRQAKDESGELVWGDWESDEVE